MFTYDAAGVWTSDNLWAWFSAQNSVSEAISALEDAGASLLLLVAASEWQAEGVRALHELIVELKDRTGAECAQLGSRLWEIEASAAL